MADYDLTFQTVNIPTNSGGATVTVEEDSNTDGTVDNSETITLSDGVTSYSTSSGAFAGSGQVRLSWSLGPPTDVTATSATIVPASVTSTLPAAPSSLTITGVTDAPDITLSWSDVSGEDEYRIYRATSPGTTLADYTQIDTVGAGVTSYTDTTVSVEQTYYYVVTAANTNGESSPSRERRARVGDGFTDQVVWDSETEWDYGGFSGTDTDGSGSLTLQPLTSVDFTYQLDAGDSAGSSGDGTATATIRDTSSGTTLATQTLTADGEFLSDSGTFTIDVATHEDLTFEVTADTGDAADASASISGPVDGTNTTLASVNVTADNSSDSDSRSELYEYTLSGSWTSPDWDYGATTTATRLAWSGVTLPNPGDSITVTITEVSGGNTVQVSPTAGSGSELFTLAPGDTYRVDVSMSTVDDDTTPGVDSLTLETHTPTANLTTVDMRDAEIDLAWDAVSVADGYEIYQSETSPVTTSDALAYSNTDPTTTTTTISGLENGEQYYFNVRTIYSGE